jgi:addiction module RelB/DinJ family antitoxin
MVAQSDKTQIIRVRVPSLRLKAAEQLFRRMGTDTGKAVNMFIAQVITERGLPFRPAAKPRGGDGLLEPNEETLAVMREADAGQGVKSYGSLDAFLNRKRKKGGSKNSVFNRE